MPPVSTIFKGYLGSETLYTSDQIGLALPKSSLTNNNNNNVSTQPQQADDEGLIMIIVDLNGQPQCSA